MSTTHTITAPPPVRVPSAGLSRFVDELAELFAALLNPRRVIGEVEAMSGLHRRAAAVEASDPLLAAELRQRASRIGLR